FATPHVESRSFPHPAFETPATRARRARRTLAATDRRAGSTVSAAADETPMVNATRKPKVLWGGDVDRSRTRNPAATAAAFKSTAFPVVARVATAASLGPCPLDTSSRQRL